MSTATVIGGIEQLCGRCVPDVLETMFFAMAVENTEIRTGPDPVSVQVAFRGSPPGEFSLKADRAVLAALGAAFLGKEDGEEMTPAEVAQTACEMANITCGSVLSEAESESGFDLDEPAVEESASAFEPDYEARFELDTGGALEIGFRFAPLSVRQP